MIQIAKHIFSTIKILSESKMNYKLQAALGFEKSHKYLYLNNIAEKDRAEWKKVLGRVEVISNNIDNLHAFYSCLYRSFILSGSLHKTSAKYI